MVTINELLKCIRRQADNLRFALTHEDKPYMKTILEIFIRVPFPYLRLNIYIECASGMDYNEHLIEIGVLI